MNEGEIVTLRQSDRTARIYGLDNFMCPACRALRHPGANPRPVGWTF